jgi:hypothetical protein
MNAELDKKTQVAVPLTPSAYNALVAAARLRDIRLIKSDFSLSPDGINRENEWKLLNTCEIQEVQFDPDGLLFAWVAAEAICKIKNKRVAAFRARYLIVYDVHGVPEEPAVEAFARRVARFAAYPYFRAHVAELASQAGVRLPPLPIIKETRLIPQEQAIPSRVEPAQISDSKQQEPS